jgi:hypothetical protein
MESEMIELKADDQIVVKTNGQTASKRTRNRVKENGPLFTFVKADIIHTTDAGRHCVLLRSTTTKWLGWLPVNEIVVSRQMAEPELKNVQ